MNNFKWTQSFPYIYIYACVNIYVYVYIYLKRDNEFKGNKIMGTW